MLFNSLDFAVFIPIVFVVYWLLPHQKNWQNRWLLVSSYFFYGWWDYRFLSLILLSTVADFVLARRLNRTDQPTARKLLISASLTLNLGLLGFFKYFDFFQLNFQRAFSFFGEELHGWDLHIILPVGISFYTFQTLSYTLDVYYKKLRPADNLVDFATFVAFFPQLVAGPIERAKKFLPQLSKARTFNFEQAKEGIQLIIFGFFRKMVIADHLSLYVDRIWKDMDVANVFMVVFASIFFSVQIYMDFSGYSRIARGLAKLLGMELMVNFNYPYASKSFSEFWTRWHISLSSWFKDYLYIPLGGSKGSLLNTQRNLLIVFTVSGLWHGARWNFIIWGFMHFLLLAIERWSAKRMKFFLPSFLKYAVVLFMINVTWVFFRAPSFMQGIRFLSKAFVLPTFLGVDTFTLMSPVALAFDLFIVLSLPLYLRFERNFTGYSPRYQELALTSLITFTMLFYSQGSAFIYFQF